MIFGLGNRFGTAAIIFATAALVTGCQGDRGGAAPAIEASVEAEPATVRTFADFAGHRFAVLAVHRRTEATRLTR